MQYNVNGEIITLKKGEGIFINTRQLHFGYSKNKEECSFICVLLHPILLCSSKSIEQKYIKPILSNNNISFYHFTQNNEWEKNILSKILEIYNLRDNEIFELEIQRVFCGIWIVLCKNIISIEKKDYFKNYHLSSLKDMISYINNNYQEKITLSDIAKVGKIAKTSCCNIFKKYINKTPNEFLIDLRLRKGMDLLINSDMTIIEISFDVGFSSASYFTEMFHKYYNSTPKEYRKKFKNKDIID